MLITKNIDSNVKDTLWYILDREGFTVRLAYILGFDKDSTGNIMFPSFVQNPINEVILNEYLISMATTTDKNTTKLFTEIFNTDRINFILSEETRLKLHFKDSILDTLDMNIYITEIFNWFKSLSLSPLLDERWANVFKSHDLLNLNKNGELLLWYNHNKDTYPFSLGINFDTVDFTMHNKILDYLLKR